MSTHYVYTLIQQQVTHFLVVASEEPLIKAYIHDINNNTKENIVHVLLLWAAAHLGSEMVGMV